MSSICYIIHSRNTLKLYCLSFFLYNEMHTFPSKNTFLSSVGTLTNFHLHSAVKLTLFITHPNFRLKCVTHFVHAEPVVQYQEP
jgi:hypothetical protein